MKITKRMREEAALLCAIAANHYDSWLDSFAPPCFALGLSPSSPAANLAREAYWSVPGYNEHPMGERWAEAEARLRTGWTPEGWR